MFVALIEIHLKGEVKETERHKKLHPIQSGQGMKKPWRSRSIC